MLSNSRIYLFEVQYKNKTWLEVLDTNQLSGIIANLLKENIPELSYKNLDFINVFEENVYTCQIHINKLKYKNQRIISKDDIKELRKKLVEQFKNIQQFSFKQLHVVNDEFSKQPSAGFMTEEMFYV
jgi:hypothetical protein